jgi:hypothetical protein
MLQSQHSVNMLLGLFLAKPKAAVLQGRRRSRDCFKFRAIFATTRMRCASIASFRNWCEIGGVFEFPF